jgi:hypothetical protein
MGDKDNPQQQPPPQQPLPSQPATPQPPPYVEYPNYYPEKRIEKGENPDKFYNEEESFG